MPIDPPEAKTYAKLPENLKPMLRSYYWEEYVRHRAENTVRFESGIGINLDALGVSREGYKKLIAATAEERRANTLKTWDAVFEKFLDARMKHDKIDWEDVVQGHEARVQKYQGLKQLEQEAMYGTKKGRDKN
jgi:hypothetical protein